MKTMKKINLLVVVLIWFSSCNDEFLEKYPLDEVSNQTFWRNEGDLEIYNNNLYFMAFNDKDVLALVGNPGNTRSQGYWYLDFMSDNAAIGDPSEGNGNKDILAGIHFPTPDPRWFLGYEGWDFVRAINIGLANYHRADVTRTIANKYAAEAHLFRAMFYFNRVNKFGDVPWVGKELNVDSEELYAQRTPREQAMDSVLMDLDYAIQYLPEDWGNGQDPGRLDKWTALGLKSRVCLFEGTWRKYHGGSNPDMWLQEAAAAAKEVIDNGSYSLYSTGDPLHDYNASHRTLDLTGNPEVIYWEKFETDIKTNNTMSYFYGYESGATKDLVEDYLCTDGLPINLSPLYQGDEVFEDVFENRDPRLRQTVMHPDDGLYYGVRENELTPPGPWITGSTLIDNPSVTGYYIVKNFDRSQIYSDFNVKITPAIILRLGEVYLNYAEAKAELGTITQADLDMTINKLRDRVGMVHMDMNDIPVDPRYVDDGVSPLIVEIRRERRLELFLEGFRYDDIRRWKQGKKLEKHSLGMRWDDAAKARFDTDGEVTVQTTEVNGVPYLDAYRGTEWSDPVFDEGKHYLWPLPLSALSQNNNLQQNPGW